MLKTWVGDCDWNELEVDHNLENTSLFVLVLVQMFFFFFTCRNVALCLCPCELQTTTHSLRSSPLDSLLCLFVLKGVLLSLTADVRWRKEKKKVAWQPHGGMQCHYLLSGTSLRIPATHMSSNPPPATPAVDCYGGILLAAQCVTLWLIWQTQLGGEEKAERRMSRWERKRDGWHLLQRCCACMLPASCSSSLLSRQEEQALPPNCFSATLHNYGGPGITTACRYQQD